VHTVGPHPGLEQGQPYRALVKELESVLEGETDPLANLANACALLAQSLEQTNWCGFYLLRGSELVLGPFQGKPACVRIPLGRGVCGAAAERRQSIVVPDVNAFPGHIACDAASRSEIVVPILWPAILRGVLDIDSPQLNRFHEGDRAGLEDFVRHLAPRVQWEKL
jgi:GAF domain-containing protein